MEIPISVRRLYVSFKSLVSDFVYSFGRAALLLLVEVQNHTVPVRERGRIRDNKAQIPYILREDLHADFGPVGCDVVSLGLWFLTFRGSQYNQRTRTASPGTLYHLTPSLHCCGNLNLAQSRHTFLRACASRLSLARFLRQRNIFRAVTV